MKGETSMPVNKRKHLRWPVDIAVKYKFISKDVQDSALSKIYDGATRDVSRGGMLLMGALPNASCLADLLTNKILIGLNFYMPTDSVLIKTLSQVVWIKAVDTRTLSHTIGLKFTGISPEDSERIWKYIVHLQINNRKGGVIDQPENTLRI